MPKLRSRGTRWRRMLLSILCVLPLGGLAVPALAQDVPAGLRACAADPDPGRRLDCYDSEMRRLAAQPAQAAKSAPPASAERPAQAASSAPPAPARQSAQAVAPAQAAGAPAPAATRADVASSPAAAAEARSATSGAASASAPEPPTPPRSSTWKDIFDMGGGSSHLTAHIVRLERSPDAMVLHLDNGQAWRQIGRASGDLSLRTGDKVTIEKHLGSYWLSSRYVSDMKVRLDTR